MQLYYGIDNLKKSDNIAVSVYYFGFNFSTKKKLIENGYSIIDTRELVSNSAHEIKFDFINYISEIGINQKSKVKWWASRIASKSSLQTDFFALLSLLHAVYKENSKSNSIVIVVDDIRVFFLLKANIFVNTDKILLIKYYLILYYVVFTKLFGFVPKRLKYLFNRLKILLTTKKYFSTSNKSETYLYSWVEPRSFDTATGIYNNPYFPRINRFMSKEDDIYIFCPSSIKKELLSKFDKNIKIDGLINYSNYLTIIKSLFGFFLPKQITNFKTYDLSILWLFEIINENINTSFISNLHDYSSWKRFFKKNKGKIVYPFENQPWEKVMISANQNMTLVGVLHTTTHELLLPFHTTEEELLYMPIPNEIVTNSDDTQRLYKKYFRNVDISIVNAGSLRFSSKKIKLKSLNDKIIIGVMLSCNKSQSEEQLDDLYKDANPNFYYYVKKHPDLNSDVKEYDNISVFQKSAIELYEQVNAIVYCSSTSGIEAFSIGLPVFRLRTQFLDLETAENSFSPQIINSIKEISLDNLLLSGNKNFFTAVKKDEWKNILEIK